jgi:hypothetical protein
MSGSLTTGYFLREESVNATARGPHLSTVQYNTPSKLARTPPPPTWERLFISKERPRSPLTARIERPLLYRGGSASKKGTWPLLPHPSEAARCTSTGDPLVCPLMPLPSSLVFPQEGVAGLSFNARIGRAPFHRARSVSKKDSLPTPSPLFAKSWKWYVKPGSPGPLSLEAPVALKMAGPRSLYE